MKPTQEFYDLFIQLFKKFNIELFENALPECMIVITRKKNVFGYYVKDRWVNQEKIKSDEIALNPLMFLKYPLVEILQTLVHEMCHMWQHHFGTPSRTGYHNKEWADKMESLGLMPSDTGKVGGKKVGQRMADYPIEDGLFLKICKDIIENKTLSKIWIDKLSAIENDNDDEDKNLLLDAIMEEIENSLDQGTDLNVLSENKPRDKKTKIKYTCPDCKTNVWGKESLNIVCGDCEMTMEEMSF